MRASRENLARVAAANARERSKRILGGRSRKIRKKAEEDFCVEAYRSEEEDDATSDSSTGDDEEEKEEERRSLLDGGALDGSGAKNRHERGKVRNGASSAGGVEAGSGVRKVVYAVRAAARRSLSDVSSRRRARIPSSRNSSGRSVARVGENRFAWWCWGGGRCSAATKTWWVRSIAARFPSRSDASICRRAPKPSLGGNGNRRAGKSALCCRLPMPRKLWPCTLSSAPRILKTWSGWEERQMPVPITQPGSLSPQPKWLLLRTA